MLGQKKRNEETPQNDDEQTPTIPRELPPLRTFVVRREVDYGVTNERTVHAHGLAIDEERMISFITFFWLDPNTQVQVAQTPKLVLNADAWDEIEEINVLFPTLEAH